MERFLQFRTVTGNNKFDFVFGEMFLSHVDLIRWLFKSLLQFPADGAPDFLSIAVFDLRKSFMIENSPNYTVIKCKIAANVTGDAIGSTAIVDIQEPKVREDAYIVDLLVVGVMGCKGTTLKVCYQGSGTGVQISANHVFLCLVDFVDALGHDISYKFVANELVCNHIHCLFAANVERGEG
nr:MAG TPA: hypothetical protein [Caudoviricetes sp.]